jgi:hypothetical protein
MSKKGVEWFAALEAKGENAQTKSQAQGRCPWPAQAGRIMG